jgi:hypothetical protein
VCHLLVCHTRWVYLPSPIAQRRFRRDYYQRYCVTPNSVGGCLATTRGLRGIHLNFFLRHAHIACALKHPGFHRRPTGPGGGQSFCRLFGLQSAVSRLGRLHAAVRRRRDGRFFFLQLAVIAVPSRSCLFYYFNFIIIIFPCSRLPVWY